MFYDYFLCIFVRGPVNLIAVDLAGKIIVLKKLNDRFSGANTQFHNFLVFQQFITMAEKEIPDALRVELRLLAILEDRLAAKRRRRLPSRFRRLACPLSSSHGLWRPCR